MNSTLAESIGRLERQNHQLVREDLFDLAVLFGQVCANSQDAGLLSMRVAFRRLSAELLIHVEREENVLFPALLALDRPGAASSEILRTAIRRAVAEHDSIMTALADLRRRRISLDGDESEARLRLDARLVYLERHVKEVIDLETAVFARASAFERGAAVPAIAGPAT